MNINKQNSMVEKTAKNTTPYYIKNYDPLAKGHMFQMYLETKIKEGSSFEEISKLLEENDVNTVELNKIYNDKELYNSNFSGVSEYENFLEHSQFKEDITDKEYLVINKYFKYANVLDELCFNLSGNNATEMEDVVNSISFLEDNDELAEKIKEKMLNEVKIRTYSQNSDKKPILKSIKQGERTFLNIKDFQFLFPNYTKSLKFDDYLRPLYTLEDSQGDVEVDYLYSLLTMHYTVRYQDGDAFNQNEESTLTKNSALGKSSTKKLNFNEIEDGLKKINDIYFGTGITKSEKNKKIFKEFRNVIMGTYKLKQKFLLLKDISSFEHLSELELKIKVSISQEYQTLISKAENDYNIDPYENDSQLNQTSDPAFKVDSFGNEVLYNILKKDNKFVKEIENFNSNLKKSINEINKELKTLEVPTNIPMIFKNNKKRNNVQVDPTTTKHFFQSMVNNDILHLLSNPGQGKTKSIKELSSQLGYDIYVVEPTSDPETTSSTLVDDEVPNIANDKLATKLSIPNVRVLSGEDFIVFVDERARMFEELGRMAMGEKLNNLLQAFGNPTVDEFEIKNPNNNNQYEKIHFKNSMLTMASNFSLFQSQDIPNSVKSRLKEIDMDSIEWENKGFISDILLNSIDTVYEQSYDEVNNKVSNKMFKNVKKNNLFPVYNELKEDKEYADVINSLKENHKNLDFSSDNYKDLMKKLESTLDATTKMTNLTKIRENWEDIYLGLKVDIINDEIEYEEKLINNLEKEKKEAKNSKEVRVRYEDYSKGFSDRINNKILDYLNVPEKNKEKMLSKFPENPTLDDYIDVCFQYRSENKDIQYSKFTYSETLDGNEMSSKSKIKEILKEVLNSVPNQKIELLTNTTFLEKIKTELPSNYNIAKKNSTNILTNLKSLKVNKLSAIKVLSSQNNEVLKRILRVPDFNLTYVSPEEFEYKKTKYFLPKIFSYLNDYKMGVSFIKDNKVARRFDAIDIVSEVISEINKQIRKDIQHKDERGGMEEGHESSEESTSVNKIAYRDINNIAKDLISDLNNIPEGVDVTKYFEKISKILSEFVEGNFLDEVKNIIKRHKEKNKVKYMNAGLTKHIEDDLSM